ncbi:MAG: uncharacterized protein JWN98_278 [Abditibacteriota bacterium]|nr:uncharacterized protein [Abditibacteriota bacterium]
MPFSTRDSSAPNAIALHLRATADTAINTLSHRFTLDGAARVPEAQRRVWYPATHGLWEWTSYTIHCEGADELRVGSRRLSPLAPGLFWLRFENRLGLVEIQALRQNVPLGPPLWVEVLSPKFPTLAAHQEFWSGLVEELFAHINALPFAFEAPTGYRVQHSQSTLRTPASLWAWHFFLTDGRELERALAAIRARPERAMQQHWQRMPLHECRTIDAETCLDLIGAPRSWEEVSASARNYPIVRSLNGRAPRTVGARQTEETLDTPLNRWLCGALREWRTAARALKNQSWWEQVAPQKRQRVAQIESALQRTGQVFDFVDEAPAQVLSAGTMQALSRRAGYAEVWKLWKRFHQTPQPFWEHCQAAVDVRDVATLYEVWAFFELAQAIGAALNVEPQWELHLSESVGLQSRSRAHFGKRRTLVYNRRTRGYSSVLRPDFTWLNGGITVVFDAKFRLDRPSPALDQSTLEQASAEQEAAEQEAAEQDTVTHDDLWTMHAYRDALGARAAVAIYPGAQHARSEQKAQSSVFYAVEGRTPHHGVEQGELLRQILQGHRQGIGALAMRPAAHPAPHQSAHSGI